MFNYIIMYYICKIYYIQSKLVKIISYYSSKRWQLEVAVLIGWFMSVTCLGQPIIAHGQPFRGLHCKWCELNALEGE